MGSLNPFAKLKTPSVPQADIGGDINKYVTGYNKALPGVIDTERQYRPKFTGLNLRDVGGFLGGVGGQEGLYALGRTASQETGQNIADARASELASMTGQAGAFRGFAQTLSPESQAQVEASQAEAARATQAARQLTPEEQRMSDQSTREAFASRGMLNSNSSVGSEVLGRDSVMTSKRAEAGQARDNAFGMAQNFYTNPGLQALGSAPLSYQAGQNQLQMGLGAIGSATPQMINPDAGANLGMQQRSNQTQANIAGQAAEASRTSGIWGALGSIGGAVVKYSDKYSDERLKTDKKKVGKTNEGLPIYTYKYKGSPTTQMGVMAQDVEKKTPSAVKMVGGFRALDYSKVK
jgi:hypothetical protein